MDCSAKTVGKECDACTGNSVWLATTDGLTFSCDSRSGRPISAGKLHPSRFAL